MRVCTKYEIDEGWFDGSYMLKRIFIGILCVKGINLKCMCIRINQRYIICCRLSLLDGFIHIIYKILRSELLRHFNICQGSVSWRCIATRPILLWIHCHLSSIFPPWMFQSDFWNDAELLLVTKKSWCEIESTYIYHRHLYKENYLKKLWKGEEGYYQQTL